jgi:PAS domain S-box-containing protein
MRVAEAIKEGRRVRSIDQHEDRYYDVHYYPISDENGEIERIAIFAIDVTKRKQTERALNSERLKFQVLADNIPLGIALIDKNDTYIYINPKFKELFGYDLEDIPDGEIWFKKAWPDPEYRHRVIATWLDNFEHFKPGEKGSWIFDVTCKDGTKKTINFMPVQLESGEILMAYEDFTQFISARKALRRARKS